MTKVYILTQGDDHVLWGVLSTLQLAMKAMFNLVRGGRYAFDCQDEDSVSWAYWWIDTETGEVIKYNIEEVTVDDPDLYAEGI